MRAAVLLVPTLLLAACARRDARVKAPTGDVPLTRLSDGFYVELGLGKGRKGLFLVDTGSYCCFATPKGERLLRAAGATVASDGTLMIGAVTIRNGAADLLEFTPWGHNQDTMAAASDGILGLDFLSRYVVGLDLRRRAMRLWPAEGTPNDAPKRWFLGLYGKTPDDAPPEGYSEIPMGESRGLCTVPVRLDGQTIEMAPDTGAGDIYVSAANARRMGWNRWTGAHDSHLYDGAVHLRHHEIHDFRLGNVRYRGAHTVNVEDGTRDVNFVGRDALVGMTMLFDFANRTMVVARARPLERKKP